MEGKHSDDQASAIAKGIGSTLAHAQDFADLLIGWGFKKLRQMGERQGVETRKHTVTARLMHAGRGSIRFLGTLGQSYYERYEELKRQRRVP